MGANKWAVPTSSMLYVFDGVWPVQVAPLLHSTALLNPAHGDVRHLPSLLTITCNFVSLLTVSSAHTKTKKTKSVNLCSAQLISAQLRRAHGQKTNKKTGPWCSPPSYMTDALHLTLWLPSQQRCWLESCDLDSSRTRVTIFVTCDLTWTCKEMTCDLTWTCKEMTCYQRKSKATQATQGPHKFLK